MNNVFELINTHHELFYFIGFVWAFFEGETFVIFAGVAAQRGLIELHWLILSVGMGTFFGDLFFFSLGRRYGKKLFSRFPKLEKGSKVVLGWVERHDVGFILTYRYMYGVRNISAIAIGMSQIDWRRYAALNFCGSFIWAVSFALGGYLFGRTITAVIEGSTLALGILVVFAGGVALLIRWVLIQRARAREAEKLEEQKEIQNSNGPGPV